MTAFQYRDQPYTFSYAALELSTDWGNWWAKLARFRVRMGLEAAAGRLPLWVNSLRGKESIGTPGAIRTRDLLLRRQALYPAELRAHLPLHCRRHTIERQLAWPLSFDGRLSSQAQQMARAADSSVIGSFSGEQACTLESARRLESQIRHGG